MMQVSKRLATLAMLARALGRQPALLGKRPTYLFVLSHMRSNTSLLSHLLGSHPEISGHSEMGLRYRHPFDLLKLRCKVFLDNQGSLEGRYVLDKILHNGLPIRPSILGRPDLRLIFIVREPLQSLRSILHMGSTQAGPDWKHDPLQVTAYYCARLAQLEDYFHAVDPSARRRRTFFLRAEELLGEPEEVLRRLSAWLELRAPLAAEYRLFDSTGRAGFGDPVGNIKAGRIIAQPGSYPHIALDPALVERATQAHARFVALFEEGPSAGQARQPAGRPPLGLGKPDLAMGGGS